MTGFVDPELEHGGIVSGQVRDFTRRFGFIMPSAEFSGYVEDEGGRLYEFVDKSSLTTMLLRGLKRVERSEIPPNTPSGYDFSK